MRLRPTPPTTDEHGDETHPSWGLARLSKISQSPPGQHLFESDIPHQHYVQLTITHASRKRRLGRDWLHPGKQVTEVIMSEYQWGALASSFGNGTGVPVTLQFINGEDVEPATRDSRFALSHREVREAGNRALAEVQDAAKALKAAYDNKAGRKELTPLVETLMNRLGNAPANMAHAAESLTEHGEAVTNKIKADIEAAVLGVAQQIGLPEGDLPDDFLALDIPVE